MKQILIFLTLIGLSMLACVGTSKPDIEATVQAALTATQIAQSTVTLPPPPANTPVPPTPTPKPPTHTPIPKTSLGETIQVSPATSRPTATPRPIPTSQPAATTSIPGWEKFAGGDVELWLPESFEGGDLREDLDVIVQQLKVLGPNFAQMAQMIEQNQAAFVLWAFDSEVDDTGFLTNVNVGKEKVLSNLTLDTYLKLVVKQLPSQFRVVDQTIVSNDRYPVARVVVECTIFGLQCPATITITQHIASRRNLTLIWLVAK